VGVALLEGAADEELGVDAHVVFLLLIPPKERKLAGNWTTLDLGMRSARC
jgi:hypothetical protein